MHFPRPKLLLLLASGLGLLLLAGGWFAWHRRPGTEDWPCWRGPRGDGTSAEKNVPVKWDVAKDKGVVWKVELPGEGHSSPIVLGKRIFVTAAVRETQERLLLCLDRDSGREQWRRTVVASPLEHKHGDNSFASGTPACDGKRVFVAFLDGAEAMVAAYDLDGNKLWLVHPGSFSSLYGFSCSPVVFEDKVIINGDQDGDAWLAALSRDDGHTLWKIDREGKIRSYSTPLIRQLDGRLQMILSGGKCTASYDPRNGQRYWMVDGPAQQCVASVVYNPKHDMLFVTGGATVRQIFGIKPDGQGNVTQTKIAWQTMKGVAYVPSPISEGDYFLVVSDGGIASCFHAGTGELYWQQRVGSQVHSSLVSANGLVYITTDKGTTMVVKPGPVWAEVAHNTLGEPTYASPAISHGHIFLRGSKHLFCLGANR
jgi:outer membrane protein assembly factor BamB